MTRRITCYVVLVTLIWGVHAEEEERHQDMFKSNTTRNDFSNLLSSLINLNEQRVNVLQKLYRLEDYGVLSEMLRSGDKKAGNGDPNNLFLIVMSKNPTDSRQRKRGKRDYQVVDSVTSLEVAGSKNIPRLDYVLDPASFVFQNDRNESTLTKSIFANTPKVYKQKKTYLIGSKIIKITPTKNPLKYHKAKQRKHFIKLLMTPKDTIQAKKKREKQRNRIEIVRKNKSSNATQILLYTSTVPFHYHSTKYNELDLPIKKYKLTTKPINLKNILASKRKIFEYDVEDYNVTYDRNTTKINDHMFTKMIVDDNHLKSETYKNILKVTENSLKKNDANNTPKPGLEKTISRETVISVKKIDDNHPKPETNPVTLKSNAPSNHHNKLIPNILRVNSKTSKIETDRRTTVLKNPDQIINGTVGSDKASESNHMNFNISSIKSPNLNINEDNAYVDDFMASIWRKNATDKVTAINILAPLIFSNTAKNTSNNLDFLKNQNNTTDNSNNDKMTTAKDLLNRHNHVKPKPVKDYDDEEYNNDGKKSNEVFTLVVTNEGKGRADKIKVLQDLQLALNRYDQPKTKPIARNTFKNCLSKKARKLCYKSCKSAYRNVCRRMKCTSRSKRALKKECKKSCEKTFKSSKYSDEDSDDSGSESESDDSNES